MNQTKTTKTAAGFKLPVVSIPSNGKKGFPIPQEEIEKIKKIKNEQLIFSFKFLDRAHDAFNLGGTNPSWYISLLDILKEVSSLTRNQLVVECRHYYEAHPHEWSKLDYKYNFNAEFIEQVECLQFRISKSRGRVHGFIIGNRFYVVWLDPHHNLYPSEKHGGRKFFESPLSAYEELELECERLRGINEELMELLEDFTKPA